MLGCGAAASAYDAYAVFGDETLVILGKLGGAELVDGVSAFVLRQAGVGQNRDELARIEPEEAHRVVHLLWAGGAVEADDVHVKGFERGERSADFGAEQHGAGGFERDLHGDGQALTGLRHRIEDADQNGFGLKQVLTGFREQDVHAAFDQGGGLFGVAGHHVVEGDVSERRQLGGGADGAGHEAWLVFRGKLLCDFFRDLRGRDVDFGDFVLQVVLGQDDAGAAKSVGLDHVAADLEEVGVNVLDNVGPAEDEQFVAAFLAPEIVHTGVAELDVRPHGAVVDDDAVFHGLKKSDICNAINVC